MQNIDTEKLNDESYRDVNCVDNFNSGLESKEIKLLNQNSKEICLKKKSKLSKAFRSLTISSGKKQETKTHLNDFKPTKETFHLNQSKKKRFLLRGTKKSNNIANSSTQNEVQHKQFGNINGNSIDSKGETDLMELKTDNKQKLQITISGKKIEPQTSKDDKSVTLIPLNLHPDAAPSHCSRSIPATDLTDTKTLHNNSGERKNTPNKFTSVVELTHSKTEKKKSIKKNNPISCILEEEIIISQNIEDIQQSIATPCKEVSTLPDNIKCPIAKLQKSTLIHTNSCNKTGYSCSTQRIESGIKNIKGVQGINVLSIPSAKYLPRQHSINNSPRVFEKSILMQHSSGAEQRGHRFPKPAKILATVSKGPISQIQKSSLGKFIDSPATHSKKQILDTELETNNTDKLPIEKSVNNDYSEKNGSENVGKEVLLTEESLTVNSNVDLKNSDEVLSEFNQADKNFTKENSRRRIRYVASSIFDVYDSLTASSSIIEAEKSSLETEIYNEHLNISDRANKSNMTNVDLTKDVPIQSATMSSNNTNNTEKREHLYKILVIGELGTGKTSFIKRYVHQFFSQNYRATIGVDFALKVLHWDTNTIVRLQLWDIAGQERFGNMTRVYYKEAVGAFIVFDVTRSGTFECVKKWKDDLDSKVQLPDGSPIPCILLANKCDQEKQGVATSSDKMEAYVRENGFAGWFETSAKENINIDEAARALVNKILLNDKLINASDLTDSEKFNLNTSTDLNRIEESKCSC